LSLREQIRRLSPRSEVLLTLFVAFGATIPQGLAALLDPQALLRHHTPPITNHALLAAVTYELVIICVLGLFLRARGWTLARLSVGPGVRDAVAGPVLAILCIVLYQLLWQLAVAAWPGLGATAQATHLVGSDLQWPTVVLASLVNPVFEEAFVCGYVIAALRESCGVTTAINVSAAIRVFCHFYQGAVGVLGIVPMALLFAYWYARNGRLLPLIVAHAILDMAALMPFVA
jgi:uncharacterized protein